MSTTYRAESTDGKTCSPALTVQVRPVLTMRVSTRKTATGRPVQVQATVRPATAALSVVLLAFSRTSGWRKVATAPTSSAGTARFTFVARQGPTRLHVATSAKGGARGAFVSGTSPSLVVTGVGPGPTAARHVHHHAKHARTKKKKKKKH